MILFYVLGWVGLVFLLVVFLFLGVFDFVLFGVCGVCLGWNFEVLVFGVGVWVGVACGCWWFGRWVGLVFVWFGFSLVLCWLLVGLFVVLVLWWTVGGVGGLLVGGLLFGFCLYWLLCFYCLCCVGVDLMVVLFCYCRVWLFDW